MRISFLMFCIVMLFIPKIVFSFPRVCPDIKDGLYSCEPIFSVKNECKIDDPITFKIKAQGCTPPGGALNLGYLNQGVFLSTEYVSFPVLGCEYKLISYGSNDLDELSTPIFKFGYQTPDQQFYYRVVPKNPVSEENNVFFDASKSYSTQCKLERYDPSDG